MILACGRAYMSTDATCRQDVQPDLAQHGVYMSSGARGLLWALADTYHMCAWSAVRARASASALAHSKHCGSLLTVKYTQTQHRGAELGEAVCIAMGDGRCKVCTC